MEKISVKIDKHLFENDVEKMYRVRLLSGKTCIVCYKFSSRDLAVREANRLYLDRLGI